VRRFGALAALAALIAFALVGAWGSAPRSAYAGPPNDAVLDWNLNAVNALVNAPTAATPGAGQTPPVSMLHLAMVQGAVYDAVNMIDGGYQPYLAGLPSAPGSASKAAAVATAAHHVLVGAVIVPPLSATIVTRLNTLYADSLAAATTQDGTSAVSAGVAAGAAAATKMLGDRASDGRYPAVPFTFAVGDDPGEWRPTNGVNDPFAWVAKVDPFLLESARSGPDEGTARAEERRVHEGLQRGQGVRRQRHDDANPPNAGADGHRSLLCRQPGGAVQPHVPRHRGQSRPDDGGAGPAVCDAQHERCRFTHRLLGRQGVLELLASDHRDPRRRQRRQPAHGR
jgi:hypothetical protein